MTTEQRAIDMMLRRTDISEDDARYYVDLAIERVCDYLKLHESDDIGTYVSGIVSIAVLMYQSDVACKNSNSSLGYKSESVSEGGISKSVTTYTGAEISYEYERQISDILAGLYGGIMFL